MSGKVGNPYHDPKTGKFTSSSGLNVDNSTRAERIKGHAKTAAKAAAGFGVALAGAAIGAIAHSALSGVTHVVKRAAAVKTAEVIATHGPRVEHHARELTKKTLTAWKIPTAGNVKPTAAVASHSPKARAVGIKKQISRQHTSNRVTVLPGTFPYKKG